MTLVLNPTGLLCLLVIVVLLTLFVEHNTVNIKRRRRNKRR